MEGGKEEGGMREGKEERKEWEDEEKRGRGEG